MTSSDVAIVNLAFARLGEKTIISLSPPDQVDRALTANALYADTRDAVLQAFAWPFAVERAALVKLSSPVPPYEFQAYFQIPTDPFCLQVLDTDDDSLPWRREGNRIASNRDSLSIRYIARVTDPTRYSAQFVDALAYRLAGDLGEAIAGKERLARRMLELYAQAIRIARGSADRERGNRPHPGLSKEHGSDVYKPFLDVR